jgi:hypothetical protein
MSAADDSAVAATNCRRESFLRDMMSPSLLLLSSCRSSFDFFSYLHSRGRTDFGRRIRKDWLRNQNRIKRVCREMTRATF